jgi:hypothetical protein
MLLPGSRAPSGPVLARMVTGRFLSRCDWTWWPSRPGKWVHGSKEWDCSGGHADRMLPFANARRGRAEASEMQLITEAGAGETPALPGRARLQQHRDTRAPSEGTFGGDRFRVLPGRARSEVTASGFYRIILHVTRPRQGITWLAMLGLVAYGLAPALASLAPALSSVSLRPAAPAACAAAPAHACPCAAGAQARSACCCARGAPNAPCTAGPVPCSADAGPGAHLWTAGNRLQAAGRPALLTPPNAARSPISGRTPALQGMALEPTPPPPQSRRSI